MSLEVRCVCSKRPLLGMGGRDASGKPYFHVKVFKQSRVFGEVIVTSGSAMVRCRDCLRWFTVTIKTTSMKVSAASPPPGVAKDLARNGCAPAP